MSTESHKYSLYKATVHSVSADNIVTVRIPAVLGRTTVIMPPLPYGYLPPDPGDVCMVAVSDDTTTFVWPVGPDSYILEADDIKSTNYDYDGGSVAPFSVSGTFIDLASGDITSPSLFVDGATGDLSVKGSGIIGTIQSTNYDGPDGGEVFADAGTLIDLDTGTITSKGLFVDGATGDVDILGDITATSLSLLEGGVERLYFGEVNNAQGTGHGFIYTSPDWVNPISYSALQMWGQQSGSDDLAGSQLLANGENWLSRTMNVAEIGYVYGGSLIQNSAGTLESSVSTYWVDGIGATAALNAAYNTGGWKTAAVTAAVSTTGVRTVGIDATLGTVTVTAATIDLSASTQVKIPGTVGINFGNSDYLRYNDTSNVYTFSGDGTTTVEAGAFTAGTGAITGGTILASTYVGVDGADGGLLLRDWTADGSYSSLATANMSGGEYCLISDGSHTYISAALGQSVYLRPNANNSTGQLVLTAGAVATLTGSLTVASGGTALTIGNGSSSSNMYFNTASDLQLTHDNTQTLYCRNGANTAFATYRGIISDASSAMYKRDVVPVRFGLLQQVLNIEPVTFRYKKTRGRGGDEGTGRMLGVIAEDLHKVAPDLTHWNTETGNVEGVSASAMATLAIGALKEMHAKYERKFAAVEARIAELEGAL